MRSDREMLFGPTNEEMITEIFRAYVRSYKDLPLNTKAGARIEVEFVSNTYDCEGIKVIQYHGWVDQALSPGESINYYERVVASMGGVAETQAFYRLFMAPGMAHCGGGPGPNKFGQSGGQSVAPLVPGSTASDDVVKALERWVEEGVAPDRLIATKYRNDAVTEPALIRRPLCLYPQVQKYNGTGDPNVASSFSCVAASAATLAKFRPSSETSAVLSLLLWQPTQYCFSNAACCAACGAG